MHGSDRTSSTFLRAMHKQSRSRAVVDNNLMRTYILHYATGGTKIPAATLAEI
jgi:hypothetical protein